MRVEAPLPTLAADMNLPTPAGEAEAPGEENNRSSPQFARQRSHPAGHPAHRDRPDRSCLWSCARAQKARLEWDTDALFATESRRDLVGQLATSLDPGQGGNVILVGHNYDWGRYNWEGVFLHLGDVEPGNRMTVYTRDGGAYNYIVERVEKVPSRDTSRHDAYLWPTDHEQLTLVTCGGPNFGRWSLRIYVIAIPIQ